MPLEAPTGPLCTQLTITNELRQLGIRQGDCLLVHSALSTIGWVSGSAEAVVLALLDAVGSSGTIVVPTHSGDNSDPAGWQAPPVPQAWWQTIRDTIPPYNAATTRTRAMGVIAETVRTWPNARRSDHPQTSFTALGSRAEFITSGHKWGCRLGEDSPLARLEDVEARVLLLGVGYESCTAFHLAEYRSPTPRAMNGFAAMTEAGRRWVEVEDVDISEEDFSQLGDDFERNCKVDSGRVGVAKSLLFSLSSAVGFAQTWLLENRYRVS